MILVNVKLDIGGKYTELKLVSLITISHLFSNLSNTKMPTLCISKNSNRHLVTRLYTALLKDLFRNQPLKSRLGLIS